MRIALLAPPLIPLTEKLKYGGIERVMISLAKGLSKFGHDITIYAPHGSVLPGLDIRLNIYSGRHDSTVAAEESLFRKIVAEQDRYDLIDSFIEPAIARRENYNYFDDLKKPAVYSMQNPTRIPDYQEYYAQNKSLRRNYFVFLSHNHSEPLRFLPKRKVIYNGIDLGKFDFREQPQGYVVFLGRIMPQKGTLEAIKLARLWKKEIRIGAKVDPEHRDYFSDCIEPELGEEVSYLGEVDDQQKNKLLGGGLVSFCLYNWHEPFGLTIVESLACGTPVLGTNLGSIPEIIEDGRHGIILPKDYSLNDCTGLLAEIARISRAECRRRAEDFSEQKMVANYLKLYEEVARAVH